MVITPPSLRSRHASAGQDDSSRVATTKWRVFLSSCLEARLSLARFEATAKLLYRTHRIHSNKLSDLLRDTQTNSGASIDPLLPMYIAKLLQLDILHTPSLVATVIKCLRARIGSDGGVDVAVETTSSKFSPQLELCLLHAAVKHSQSRGFAKSRQGTMVLLKQIRMLASSLSQPEMIDAAKVSSSQPQDADAAAMVVAAGDWTVAVFENAGIAAEVRDVLSDDEIARDLADVLIGFGQLVNTHAQHLYSRLAFSLQSHSKLHEAMEVIRDKQVAQLTVAELQAQVADVPSTYARASLVVHLDALLYCCPTVDQNALIAYLQARYKGDLNRASVDLVLASFDLLVLQASRGDSEDHTFAAQSLIVNKLPLLLVSASSIAIVPFNVPVVLQQALGRVENTVPQRAAFLTACALHGLITEDDTERITGSRAPAHQAGAPAYHATLLQQYKANPQVVEKFIAALDSLDGNAAAYAETIVDTLQTLCIERHTMPLKTICHGLVSNPHRLDAIAVMVGVDRLINPVCQLLGTWPQEADHSESHAVYDEFGSCFLLVVACVRRFGIDLDTDATRFVSEVMSINDRPRRHGDLDEAQRTYLNEWIKALYEDEGISDELMSTCPPQEFYKIVGTLFRVSLNAYKNGALSKDKLHSGLELLLEPFLLPSILCVCPWLAKYAWETSGGSEGLSIVLRELIKPNDDPSSMRNVVLSLAGPDIEDALSRSYSSAQQDSLTILKSLLAPYLRYRRDNAVTAHALALELDLPALTPGDNDIKLTFNSLCAWSAGISQVMPTYSHRQLLDAQRRDGASTLLVHIIDCIIAQTTTGLSDFALDLAAAVICALSHDHHTSDKTAERASSALQDALRSKLIQTPSFARKEPLQAQIVIRLSRRLEAELTHAIPLDLGMPLHLTNMVEPVESVNSLQSLDLPAATEVVMDVPQIELPPLETIPDPLPMPAMFDGTNDLFDLDMEAALAVQDTSGQPFSALPGSADDDIFAGLTFDTDMDFS